MAIPKGLRLWCITFGLLLLCVLAACGAYIRLGTDLLRGSVSPDGKWDARLIVRNGGAMTGYGTVVSVCTNDWVARQAALFWPTAVFVVDDNNGAVL